MKKSIVTPRPCPPLGCRAVIYTRVSTVQQAGSGRSLDVQDIECAAWVKAHDQVVIATLSDPGKSGSSIKKRPGLREALRLLADGEADTLVVKSMSRLTRTLEDWLYIANLALEQGWNLVLLDQGIDLHSASGRFTASIIAAVGQWQREMTAEQTASTFRTLDIRTGPAVTAYTPDQMRRALDMRQQGASLGTIAAALALRRGVVQRIIERGETVRFVTRVSGVTPSRGVSPTSKPASGLL